MQNIVLDGITYSNVPAIQIPKSGGGNALFYDLPDTIKMGVIRGDAEKVKTYSCDKLLVKDDKVTLPAYNTTAQTVQASETLSDTYPINVSLYNYFIIARFVTNPIYSSDTKAKGRAEQAVTSIVYEVCEIPANNFITPSGKAFTSNTLNISGMSAFGRLLYWSSPTAVGLYTSHAYGCYQAPQTPTIASNAINIKTPATTMRGHSTYYSSTYWGYTTDIRAQYVIDIYRAAKSQSGVNGWSLTSEMQYICDCLNTNNFTLK